MNIWNYLFGTYAESYCFGIFHDCETIIVAGKQCVMVVKQLEIIYILCVFIVVLLLHVNAILLIDKRLKMFYFIPGITSTAFKSVILLDFQFSLKM